MSAFPDQHAGRHAAGGHLQSILRTHRRRDVNEAGLCSSLRALFLRAQLEVDELWRDSDGQGLLENVAFLEDICRFTEAAVREP